MTLSSFRRALREPSGLEYGFVILLELIVYGVAKTAGVV